MYPFFIAAFITGTAILFDIRAKSTRYAYQYLIFFFLIAGINFLFQSKCHATNNHGRTTMDEQVSVSLFRLTGC